MNRAAFVPSVAVVLLGFASSALAAEQDRHRPGALGGAPMTLVKVAEDSITVKTMPTQREGSQELTFAVDPERTKVIVGVLTGEEEGPGGQVRRRYKTQPGTLADLKKGQMVRVKAEDDLATEITAIPNPPPRAAKPKDPKAPEKK